MSSELSEFVESPPPPFMDGSMFELSIPLNFAEFRERILHTFEFKWNGKARNSQPKAFANSHPNSTYEVITPENYRSFLK